MSDLRLLGYVPGAIGRITELHAAYYKKHWDFDLFFESKVATELSEFLNRFNPVHDGFWLAMMDDKIVGAVAVDGNEAKTSGARLRWFIVDPEYQGRGVGQRLLEEAVAFCRRANIRRVYPAFVCRIGCSPSRVREIWLCVTRREAGQDLGQNGH